MNNPVDPLSHFLKHVEIKEKTVQRLNKHSSKVREEKSKQLIPIRRLLKQVQDLGVNVRHTDYYQDRQGNHPAQPLEPYENESSPSFLPGVSIYLNHPAVIEIAIPNEDDRSHPGVVSIMCTTFHPHASLVAGPFYSMDAACLGLAEFLAKSLVNMTQVHSPPEEEEPPHTPE